VLVGTLHNLTMAGVERDRSAIFELAHRVTDRLTERTTAICQAASEHSVQRRAVPPAKMMTVHNGIDPDQFAANAEVRQRVRKEMGLEGQFVWLCIGRLVLQKAYPTLLRAMARLGEGNRTLLICGVGPLHDELVAMAGQLGVSNRVRFLGLRGDVPDLMSAADAFCLSSDTEGLPLVLLQACAAGLPIVATNVAGNPEVVTEGANGFLTPAGDPEAFAAVMSRVEGLSAAERAAIGNAGIVHVRANFDAERIADKWEQIFRRLLETGGGQVRRIAISGPQTAEDQELAACAS
jgi:glycosyltransferase involved in cell wall biosynthesis